jgi:hypothetical protein
MEFNAEGSLALDTLVPRFEAAMCHPNSKIISRSKDPNALERTRTMGIIGYVLF